MKLIYESKYAPGETVYVLVGWVTDVRVAKRRVESVIGVSHNGVMYQLETCCGGTLFNSKQQEDRLYSTRSAATKAGRERRKAMIAKQRARLEADIEELTCDAEERIDRIKKTLTDDINQLRKQLKELQ